ncbi:MAG: MerR family DNA-binding protein [Gemmatimonadaceae bacterium]|nr:MerR family DNA-binding protein [Gemmatimonadaceae bacterium]
MKHAPPAGMLIGAFAAATGLTVESVRYYERRGLLLTSVAQRGRGRRYDAAAVARVQFIKASQGLGFTLDEVAALLRLDDGRHCRETQALATVKLATVREKLATLRRMESALASLVAQCDASSSATACPLIAALSS